MGKGKRERSIRLTEKEEQEARKLLNSEMEARYRVVLDEALYFTQIAMSRGEFPKEKYMEAVTRAIYYTAWGDCERSMSDGLPIGRSRDTKQLIADVAQFKEITYDEAEKLLMSKSNTLASFLEGCRNLGVSQ